MLDRHTERVGLFRMVGVAVVAALILAAPAGAQEDGVYIDPDSPSAKEYELPFESERRQADPGQNPSDGIVQGSRTSPLFGAGIVSGDGDEEDGGATKGTSRSEKRGDGAAGGSSSSKPRMAEGDDDEVLQAATSNPGAPDGGVGVPLTIGGLAVGVLVLGGLAGLLLRRRA